MTRCMFVASLLLVLGACGKKEEAPQPSSPPASSTASQHQSNPAVVQPSTSKEPATHEAQPATSSDGKYIVVKGDTLYSIAKRHGLNHHELAEWNNIKNPRHLQIGHELTLMPPNK